MTPANRPSLAESGERTIPGLPLGAPGREFSSPTCETACTMLDKDSTATPRVRREFYETLLVRKDGKTSTYARH